MLVDKPLPSERPTGIGVAAFNMAFALSKRNIDVRLVCRGEKENEEAIDDFLTVQTIKHYSRDSPNATLGNLRAKRYDLIHVHSSSALPSIVLSRILRRIVVYHSHSVESLRPIHLTLMRLFAMKASQCVVTVSKKTQEDIVKRHWVSLGKTAVAHNGVDVELFRPLTNFENILSKYDLHRYDKIILSVGRVQKGKGQWRMLRCLPKIVQRWPKLVYLNAGTVYDADYLQRLIEMASSLGVSQSVKFLGAIPSEDLVGLINLADLCVHPSTREAFGLAVAEEMACGKAVVAFNIDAIPEIVENGIDGILVEPSSGDSLVGPILNLLDHQDLAKRIGSVARSKIVSKFTWNETAATLEKTYDMLLTRC
jgi:glycosyltransferase involved in cell wall biosynthesis